MPVVVEVYSVDDAATVVVLPPGAVRLTCAAPGPLVAHTNGRAG